MLRTKLSGVVVAILPFKNRIEVAVELDGARQEQRHYVFDKPTFAQMAKARRGHDAILGSRVLLDVRDLAFADNPNQRFAVGLLV